jgi:protein ImuB
VYACLYTHTGPREDQLLALASPAQIVAAIEQVAERAQVPVQLAVASNPDSALLLAHHGPEPATLMPDEEQTQLARLPVTALFAHDPSADPKLLTLLDSWGVKTCGELAALPEQGLAERLGRTGVHLQCLARGQVHRPLRLVPPPTRYEEQVSLEHPVEQRESLLFLISRLLQELCRRLQAQSEAARCVQIEFALETEPDECAIEFAVPLAESAAILKLLQLHLERHGPPSAILGFILRLVPAAARRVQQTLFDPPTPPADKLQVTLARVAGGLGPDAVGCPQLLDTHRPDAFKLTPLPLSAGSAESKRNRPRATFRLALRRFRPPLPARVQTQAGVPYRVQAKSIRGRVRRCSGGWKTAGEWWVPTSWSREEWDVELENGALYRLSRERATGQWYVDGVYD